MSDLDAKRGRVIGAAYRLDALLCQKAGATADWPIRMQGESPEIDELAALLTELRESIKDLKHVTS